MGLAILTSNF